MKKTESWRFPSAFKVKLKKDVINRIIAFGSEIPVYFIRQFSDIKKILGPERPSFFIHITKQSREIKPIFHHQMRLFSM